MLQYAGACHGSFLGYVSHNKNGNTQPFGKLQKECCGLPYLGNTAGGCGNVFTVHGLYGVNNHNLRFPAADGVLNQRKIGLTQKKQIVVEAANSLGTHLNLL